MIARPLVRGEASGPAAVLTSPLSFWGGVDDAGLIVDRLHPQHGLALAGSVLIMPSSRGSSSSSSVLAELIRRERAPHAIILEEPDAIVVLGAIVAEELYGRRTPIVVLPGVAEHRIPRGANITVHSDDRSANVTWSAS